MYRTFYLLCAMFSAVLSWALNHSFWWAVFHWIFSITYIVYAICVRGHEIMPALTKLFN